MIPGATPLLLGEQALQRNDFATAETLFRQALAAAPQSIEALRGLGYAAFQQGHLDTALSAIETVVQRAPSDLLARLLMGRLCLRLQEPALAKPHFQRILKKMPSNDAALSGMTSVALALNQPDEARQLVKRLLALHPKSDVAWLAAATTADRLGEFDRAEACYAKLIEMQPARPIHRYHYAGCLLRRGQWAQGWAMYESRFASGMIAMATLTAPRWEGQSVATLLLWAEQGLGDVLQFSRFVALAKAKVERVILAAPYALVGLLARSLDVSVIALDEAARTPCDAQLALMSLPQVLELEDKTLAPVGRFIKVDPARREQWAQRLALSNQHKNIGVVYTTSVAHETEQYPQTRRSCAVKDLERLAAVSGACWFNLTVGAQPAESSNALANKWRDLSTQLNDFDDTAAVLDLLDGLVTVDTSVAHVMGGLDKPMALLLPQAASWRWGQAAERTAWYPKARLFRQDQAGAWATPIEQICAEGFV